MIKWLHEQNYILRDETSDTYVLGSRIGKLYKQQPVATDVISAAHPIMTQISDAFDATCYLSIRAQNHCVVVATTQSSQFYGVGVQVGAQMPLLDSPTFSCLAQELSETEELDFSNEMNDVQLEHFKKARKRTAKSEPAYRFDIAGPSIFEMSFLGPQQAQLTSFITVAKVLSTEEQAKDLADRLVLFFATNNPNQPK